MMASIILASGFLTISTCAPMELIFIFPGFVLRLRFVLYHNQSKGISTFLHREQNKPVPEEAM